jgi:hypothetical protein
MCIQCTRPHQHAPMGYGLSARWLQGRLSSYPQEHIHDDRGVVYLNSLISGPSQQHLNHAWYRTSDALEDGDETFWRSRDGKARSIHARLRQPRYSSYVPSSAILGLAVAGRGQWALVRSSDNTGVAGIHHRPSHVPPPPLTWTNIWANPVWDLLARLQILLRRKETSQPLADIYIGY